MICIDKIYTKGLNNRHPTRRQLIIKMYDMGISKVLMRFTSVIA